MFLHTGRRVKPLRPVPIYEGPLRGPYSLILNSLYIIIRTTVSSKSLLLRTPWRGNGKVNGIELEEFATNCYTGRYIPDRRDPV